MNKQSANDNQIISGGDPSRKYFTMMLNMAEDELDPFQYRLLAHYLRWAGHGGSKSEGLKTTAKTVKMSISKVRSTRRELVSMGYILVQEPNQEEIKEGVPAIITIVDRWEENVARYSRVKNDTPPMSKMTGAPALPHVKNDTPPMSNLAPLEEHIEKQEEKRDSSATPIGSFQEEGKGSEAIRTRIPKIEMNPMKDAIVAAFQWSWETMSSKEKSQVQGVARELCMAGRKPEDVIKIYKYCKSQTHWSQFGPNALASHASTALKSERKDTAPSSGLPASKQSVASGYDDHYYGNRADISWMAEERNRRLAYEKAEEIKKQQVWLETHGSLEGYGSANNW